jgi:hypothetical protein
VAWSDWASPEYETENNLMYCEHLHHVFRSMSKSKEEVEEYMINEMGNEVAYHEADENGEELPRRMDDIIAELKEQGWVIKQVEVKPVEGE